jgi:ABC-type Fe3+-siderophore transport system permease subunit
MNRPRSLLIGCGVVFAILGVMFFLGMIVPAIVRWVL